MRHVPVSSSHGEEMTMATSTQAEMSLPVVLDDLRTPMHTEPSNPGHLALAASGLRGAV